MKGVVLAAFLVDRLPPSARILIAADAVGERFYDISEVSIFYNGRLVVLWPTTIPVEIETKESDG